MAVANKIASDEKNGESSKSWPQIVAIAIACLSSVTTGFFFAWTSPFVVKIVNDIENYHINEEQANLFVTLPPIATLLTSPLISSICDKIGRKPTVMLMAVPHMTSWIIIAFSRNLYLLYLARVIGGFADACHYAAVPAYIGEIATPRIRGFFGNSISVSICFGQFLINIIGSYVGVQESAYICMPLPVILFVLMLFMPESPYFLIMKDKETKAKESLRQLRGKYDVEEDYLQLKADVDRQMSERGTWKDLVTISSNRKALMAGIFMRVSQQASGVSVFIMYTQYIFERTGSDISSEVSSIIFTGLLCGLVLGVGSVVELIGRRRAYIISSVTCGIILVLEATFFYIEDKVHNLDLTFMNWFPLAGMILYIIFCALGIIVIPTMMIGELFSASIKGKGICVLSIVFGIAVFATNNIFFYLNAYIGFYAPFLFFGCCNIISSVVSFYLVPETKGKTLEEIQQSLKKKNTS